jgi:chromosome segregation ATPase
MEKQLVTVKNELAAAKHELVEAKEQLVAEKHEHEAANHENVVAKEELVVGEEKLSQKNEELDVLRKRLQETQAMHTQLLQQKGSAPGPEPVPRRVNINTKACSLCLAHHHSFKMNRN